ncbi:MAG: dephospho-CoA kinase [Clostridia bacterium]|nr:dephospho-CoA kinase [Clostridia bacterium]
MYTIGLTGGIASGKSTVAALLRAFGAHVIDADAISRALTATGGVALPIIRAHFGAEVFEGNALNRRALAAQIFADEEARLALDAIMFPLVYADMFEQVCALVVRGEKLVVLEVPLLFESGFDAQVDEIWLTVLPRDEQLRRLMARNQLTEAEAVARIDSQWPIERKERRARQRFDTAQPIDRVAEQVRAAWQHAKRKAESPNASPP